MYDVSEEYIDALGLPVQDYRLKVNIDGTEYDESILVGGSLSITNQCSETDIVQIGSVYCAEMKCTVASGVIERNTWQGAKISISEGMDVEGTFEYVPLGIFTVSEANHTEDGVQIVAYDNMLLLDKDFNLSSTIGTAYSILSMLCQDCGLQLGMTESQIRSMPNGTQSIALFSENDCQTYRDVVFWLAQLLGAFATIGRDGKLYLRNYPDKSDFVMIATDEARIEGGAFSDFVTEYSGVGFTDIETQEYIYVSEDVDDKLTYNLGANPFMQYGTLTTKRIMARNILGALRKISYTPFTTGYINTPAYDLGDVIRNNSGIADDSFCCIMWFEYSFSGGIQVEGYGQNPALATAQNKTDKDIAGLLSRVNKDSIQFYTFKNADQIVVGDGETQSIMNIRFTTQESRQVTFQGEILVDADVTLDEVEANIRYFLDGAEILDYQPTETWSEDGKHIISLYYVIDVEPNTLYRWQVYLNSVGGTLIVPMENARGTIWGQGLVASEKWDGYIDAEDRINAIPIDDSISIAPFTDETEVELVEWINIEAEDSIGAIPVDDSIEVAPFEDSVYIDKTSLYFEGFTWGDIQTDLWGDVLDEHVW